MNIYIQHILYSKNKKKLINNINIPNNGLTPNYIQKY